MVPLSYVKHLFPIHLHKWNLTCLCVLASQIHFSFTPLKPLKKKIWQKELAKIYFTQEAGHSGCSLPWCLQHSDPIPSLKQSRWALDFPCDPIQSILTVFTEPVPRMGCLRQTDSLVNWLVLAQQQSALCQDTEQQHSPHSCPFTTQFPTITFTHHSAFQHCMNSLEAPMLCKESIPDTAFHYSMPQFLPLFFSTWCHSTESGVPIPALGSINGWGWSPSAFA